MLISSIKIGDRLRAKRDVSELARSIREVGLLNPITVTTAGHLVAGLHRLEACRSLGWTDIPANVVGLDELKAQLAEIDENLVRNDLTELERAQHLKRRKELYEAAHPETRPVTERGGPGRGKTTGKLPTVFAPTFADDTAKKTSSHPDTVRRSVARAERIAPDVQELIAAVPEVADSGVELDALAKLEPEEQREVARVVVERKAAGERKVGVRETAKKIAQQERETAKAAQVHSEPARPVIRHESALTVMGQMEQGSIDLLLTDPPYMTDVDDVAKFAALWVPLACRLVRPTGRAYICTGSYPEELVAYLDVLLGDADLGHLALDDVLVWTYRNTLGPSPKLGYKRNWQAVFYLVGRKAAPLACPEMLEQFSVQDIAAPDGRQGNRYHPWQKPDELAERFIRHATKPGDLVFDPFAGTGTFVLAAARLGRRGVGVEVDGAALAVAERRGCRCETR